MNTGVEERTRDIAVRLGRRRDRNGVDLADQFAPIRERRRSVVASTGSRRRGIGVARTDEIDRAFPIEFRIISCVMPAQAADADGGRPQLSCIANILIRNRFSAILYILI